MILIKMVLFKLSSNILWEGKVVAMLLMVRGAICSTLAPLQNGLQPTQFGGKSCIIFRRLSITKMGRNPTLIVASAQSSQSSWEKEEARWLREENRWLREEARWLREEARWNAERKALQDEIQSLKDTIEILRHQEEINALKEGASLDDLITRLTRLLQAFAGADGSATEISATPFRQASQLSGNPSSLDDFESVLKRGSSVKSSVESSERPAIKPDTKPSGGVYSMDEISAEQSPNAGKKKKMKRTLKRGSEGEDVKEMQEALERLGFYSGEEDMEYSFFSGGTESAVKSWQAALGIVEDGRMTEELLAKLFAEQAELVIDLQGKVGKDGTSVPSKEVMNVAVEKPVVTIKEVAEIQQTIRSEPKGVEISERRVFLLGENRWEEPGRLANNNQHWTGSNVVTPTKCFSCRGEGRMLCTECDGTGELNVEEQFLEWVEEGAKCPYCEGTGFVVCDVCDGKVAKL